MICCFISISNYICNFFAMLRKMIISNLKIYKIFLTFFTFDLNFFFFQRFDWTFDWKHIDFRILILPLYYHLLSLFASFICLQSKVTQQLQCNFIYWKAVCQRFTFLRNCRNWRSYVIFLSCSDYRAKILSLELV